MSRSRRGSLPAANLVRLLSLSLWLPAQAGCERILVLGSECGDAPAPCGTQPDAQPPSEGDAQSEGCDASTEGPCGCDAPSAPQLLAHWRLDESAGDSAAEATGRANSGVLQGYEEGKEAWTPGQVAGALRFDGVDDHVQLGAVTGQVKTLSLWLQPQTKQVVTSETPIQRPSSHGPLDQWSEPENAYFRDGLGATVASLIGAREQHWGGFQLREQVPRDAVIQGITVTVQTGNLGVLGAFVVELSWDGGQSHTVSRYGWGQLILGSDLRQAGGLGRLWGRSWAPEEFSADNFRVRGSFGGIANAMVLDYLAVQVHYTEQATPRTIVSLSPGVALTFAGEDGQAVAVDGWADSTVYVNGSVDAPLQDGWNHVVVSSESALAASDLVLGGGAAPWLTFPFEGLMDDVQLFDQALTPEQLAALSTPPTCASSAP